MKKGASSKGPRQTEENHCQLGVFVMLSWPSKNIHGKRFMDNTTNSIVMRSQYSTISFLANLYFSFK